MDDRRKRTEDLRDTLALAIAGEEDGSKLAALSREYRQVLDLLESLSPPETGTKADELAARRAGRNTVTADPSRAARHRKSAGG